MKGWVLLLPLLYQDDVPRLIEQLRSDRVEERNEAEKKLVSLGDQAEPALRKALESSDAEIAARAKSALSKIGAAREEKAWDVRIKALPKTFGERKWKYVLNGKEVGGGVMKTLDENGKLTLDDTLQIQWRGKELSLRMRQTCASDRTLSPVKIVSEGKGDDEVASFEADVNDGKLTAKKGARNVAIELSKRTVTEFALFRVVGTLPQKEGFAFEFDSLESSELNYKPGHRLDCVGQEDVAIEGKNARAMKWKHSGKSIGDHFYWVKDGLVIRALIDGRKEWIFADR